MKKHCIFSWICVLILSFAATVQAKTWPDYSGITTSGITNTLLILDKTDTTDSAAGTVKEISQIDFFSGQTVASHADTSATGAELNTLTDDSMGDALHRHSELSAIDGTPDAVVKVDAVGEVGVNIPDPTSTFHVYEDDATADTTNGILVEQVWGW